VDSLENDNTAAVGTVGGVAGQGMGKGQGLRICGHAADRGLPMRGGTEDHLHPRQHAVTVGRGVWHVPFEVIDHELDALTFEVFQSPLTAMGEVFPKQPAAAQTASGRLGFTDPCQPRSVTLALPILCKGRPGQDRHAT